MNGSSSPGETSFQSKDSMEDDMELTGKNCLITGANSGLGLAVSKQFAQRGANMILVCRSEEKGDAAVREISVKAPEAKTDLMICDMASMRSIHDFIDDTC